MPEPTYLDLTAEDGSPLRHKYLRHESGAEGLVVLLPGDNYGVDGPLLYYPAQALWELGWDTAALTYGYQSAGKPFSPLLLADTLAESQRAVESLLSAGEYERLALIGKSLGAALAGLICQQLRLPPAASVVYLTPPLGPMFNPVFLGAGSRACLVVGTKDRYYSAAHIDELQSERRFTLIQIEGADHSMNFAGDLPATLGALNQVVEGVVEFLRR